MTIYLNRHSIDETVCNGSIRIDSDCFCSTTEQSENRPPVGTYHILTRFDKRYGCKMPFLVEAPNTFLAFGNEISSCIDGRILIGAKIIHGHIIDSHKTFMLLLNRINEGFRRDHEVTLVITEDSTSRKCNGN